MLRRWQRCSGGGESSPTPRCNAPRCKLAAFPMKKGLSGGGTWLRCHEEPTGSTRAELGPSARCNKSLKKPLQIKERTAAGVPKPRLEAPGVSHRAQTDGAVSPPADRAGIPSLKEVDLAQVTS